MHKGGKSVVTGYSGMLDYGESLMFVTQKVEEYAIVINHLESKFSFLWKELT